MTAPAPARTYSLGAVLPHVRRAAELMGNRHGIATILGWRASAKDKMGHPAGLALDFMCDRSTGDRLNADLHANAAGLGLKYTIWEQRYHPVGGASEPMEDRGSPTQNHFDHVHAQFNLTGGNGELSAGPGGAGGSTDAGAGGGMFDGWARDLHVIAMKASLTGAALVLVVVGVRQTVKN